MQTAHLQYLEGPLSLFQIEDSLTDQCRWISLKHKSYAKITCFQACTARTEGQQVMCRSNVIFKTVPDIYQCTRIALHVAVINVIEQ